MGGGLAQRAGEREAPHAMGAGVAQFLCAGRERGACGHDVIHEQQRAAAHKGGIGHVEGGVQVLAERIVVISRCRDY